MFNARPFFLGRAVRFRRMFSDITCPFPGSAGRRRCAPAPCPDVPSRLSLLHRRKVPLPQAPSSVRIL